MTDRTCSTCKHWTRHPWPNRRGWYQHGTCTALQIAPQGHLLNKAPGGHMPMVDTNHDFGCNKWDGERREDITVSFPPAPTQAQLDRAIAMLEAHGERMRAKGEQDD